MAEQQETVHVVMRAPYYGGTYVPVKVFDDRDDARAYAKRMNNRPNSRPNSRFYFTVHPVKKG